MLRYLRITVTGVSVVACLLLIAVWAVSYSWPIRAYATFQNFPSISLISRDGVAGFSLYHVNFDSPEWDVYIDDDQIDLDSWSLEVDRGHQFVTMPHWFLLSIIAAIAGVPWIKSRFSLRTMLIAMAIIAAWLGLIVSTL